MNRSQLILHKWKKEVGIKQVEMARVLGCSRSHISRVYNGKKTICSEKQDKVIRIIDVEKRLRENPNDLCIQAEKEILTR